jgi:exonuclease VII small subunit
MAVATVTEIAGIVQLATGGAAAALVPASEVLVKAAQEFLGSESPKRVDIFNPFTITIHPTTELRGLKSYVLLHRGTDNLDGDQFCVRSGEKGADVFYRNTPFRDGAWVLVRIRRPDTYIGDPRPWSNEYEQAKRALDELFDSWKTGRLTLEQAKASLQRGTDVAPTVADRVNQVARRIRSDQALILADSRKYAGVLVAYLIAANEAVAANDPDRYKTVVSAIEDAIRLNAPAPPALRDAITTELGTASGADSQGNCPPLGDVRFDDNVVGRSQP